MIAFGLMKKQNSFLDFAPVVVLLLVGFFIRYFYIFELHPAEKYIFSDMQGYFQHAQALLNDTVRDSFFFQPIGLPIIEAFFLDLAGNLEGLKWLQLFASFGTLVLLWLTARNLFGPKKSPETTMKDSSDKPLFGIDTVVLAFATFHFPFIFFSGLFMAENMFIFFLCFLIWGFSRFAFPFRIWQSVLIGCVFGFGFLMKTSAALILPLFFAWAIFYAWKKKYSYLLAIKSLSVISLCFGSFLLAHGIWSYQKIDQFLLSPTSGGLNFVEGKCPWKDNSDSAGYRWKSPLFTQLQEGDSKKWDRPFTDSSFFSGQALHCIADRPQVLIESLRYIPYLFIGNDLWPSLNTLQEQRMTSKNYSLYFAFVAIPGFLWALFMIVQKPMDRRFLSLLIPAFAVMLIVWLFKSEQRFRAPFDVVFIPLLVFGWHESLRLLFPHVNSKRILAVLFFISTIVGILFTTSLFFAA